MFRSPKKDKVKTNKQVAEFIKLPKEFQNKESTRAIFDTFGKSTGLLTEDEGLGLFLILFIILFIIFHN
jgi:hypothetical protein